MYHIPGCLSINNKPLKFDISLKEYGVYIEYDGEQHFRPVENWGGEDEFISVKQRDSIKNEFCSKNNIKLYRISYKDNIEAEVNKIISLHQEK